MAYLDTHGLTTLWNKIKNYITSYHDSTKQNTLVSGTNIKTVNSNSLLGSGNVSVGTYSKPSGGIPKTDLASAVQTSLGKADTALQSAPVTSVNSKTGAVSLSASDVGAAATSHTHADPQIYWGGSSLSGTVSPDDMGCIDEFGHNKLAFLSPECINVAYSTDGGTTWVDYGLTDTQKIAMVTTSGPSVSINKGAMPTASNITNLKTRVRISTQTTSKVQKLYTSTRKWLINISTQGATGCTVTIRKRTIANHMSGTETWTAVGTYPISGYSGWNSIPFQETFGGSTSSQTNQTGEIEFVFGATGITSSSYSGALSVMDFRLIGATNWLTPSELARAGHLYTIDSAQKATFPADVDVTGTLSQNGTSVSLNGHKHTKSQITDFPTLATVATSGSYNDLLNKPTIPSAVTVDTAISSTSTNPVQNKVIKTALDGKVSTVSGKGLSTNDYTTGHKNLVTKLDNRDDVGSYTHVFQRRGINQGDWDFLTTTDIFVEQGVTLGDELYRKVDKVTGKGLSTNDFTTTLKNKLDGIASGAEVNVQADWNQTNTSADDYIKNKPTIPEGSVIYHSLGQNTNGAIDQKVVTDAINNSLQFEANYSDYIEVNIGSEDLDALDLARYYWVSDELNNKVSVVSGKGLSTNDFTNTYKSSVDNSIRFGNFNTDYVEIYNNEQTRTADISLKNHTHDDRYYTESEVNTKLDGKANSSHDHDDRYYDMENVEALLEGKVNIVSGKGLSTNDFTTAEKNKLASLQMCPFPVNAIYMSMDSANPSTIWSGTSWIRIAEGKTLIGVDGNDTDFNESNKTGGEKTHLLTKEESGLPKHGHSNTFKLQVASVNNTGSATTKYVNYGKPTGTTYTNNSAITGGVSDNAGSNASQAHNNMPPYLTCYIWKRTS